MAMGGVSFNPYHSSEGKDSFSVRCQLGHVTQGPRGLDPLKELTQRQNLFTSDLQGKVMSSEQGHVEGFFWERNFGSLLGPP